MAERKKKLMKLFLSVLMSGLVLAGCGKKQAQEPQYLDEPVEVATDGNFDEDIEPTETNGIGEAAVLPSGAAANAALAGTNTVTFFFKNPVITTRTGNVAVVNMSDYSILSSVSVSEAGKTESMPMTPEELSSFGWPDGVKINVYLDSCFLPSQQYAVRTDEGVFTDGTNLSKAITENNVTFTTKDYGINVASLPNALNQGSKMLIPVVLGGGASLARADGISNCTIKQTSFTQNGNLEVLFDNAGQAGFTLTFTSSDGKILDTLPLSFTVQAK